MTNWVAVCDGGASGSRYALYNEHGDVVARHKAGPASLTLSVEKTWLTIEAALKRMMASISDSVGDVPVIPQRIVLGLAGSLQQSQRSSFLRAIPSNIDASLYTDGYAQLIGASGGRPGTCLSAGTGTVIHWLDESNAHHMAGGWGFPTGDDGSGAWLGMQLLNDFLWHRDGERLADASATDLFSALESSTGPTTSELQQWSTCAESTRLATLVPMLAEFAADGNPYAESLVARGVQQCARLINLAPPSLPLYVVGGLATLYADGLQASFGERMKTPEGDSLSGLYWLSQT